MQGSPISWQWKTHLNNAIIIFFVGTCSASINFPGPFKCNWINRLKTGKVEVFITAFLKYLHLYFLWNVFFLHQTETYCLTDHPWLQVSSLLHLCWVWSEVFHVALLTAPYNDVRLSKTQLECIFLNHCNKLWTSTTGGQQNKRFHKKQYFSAYCYISVSSLKYLY